MIKKLIIPFCFCLFGLIWACNQPSDIQPVDFSISNVQKYLNEYNSGKLSHQQAQFYTGSVYIRAASEDRMVIYFVDKVKGENLMFLLQMKENKDKDFQLELEEAQLFYFRNQLIVNSLNEDLKLMFKLTDAERLRVEEKEELQFKYLYAGFGLAKVNNIELNSSLTSSQTRNAGFGDPGDPPPQEVSCKCVYAALAADCDSGGVGSSSCTATVGSNSCSVSCTSSYYSCCNE